MYQINPQASGKELRLEPRPDDQTDRTTARLPRPTRQAKTDGQARTHFDREESESDHSLSLLARILQLSKDLGRAGTKLAHEPYPTDCPDRTAFALLLTAKEPLDPTKLLLSVGLVSHIKQRFEIASLLDRCITSGNKLVREYERPFRNLCATHHSISSPSEFISLPIRSSDPFMAYQVETMSSEDERSRHGNSVAGLSNLQMRALNDSFTNLKNTGLEQIHPRLDEIQKNSNQTNQARPLRNYHAYTLSGRCVATKSEPKLGRYEATELESKLGRYDDQIIPTKVRATDRSRKTDRAVYQINPQASGKELRLEPRPDDRTDRTTARLPRPTHQAKTDANARTHFDREESESGHSLSRLVHLIRAECPSERTDGSAGHYDQFLNFDDQNFSKARILQLSKDLGRLEPSWRMSLTRPTVLTAPRLSCSLPRRNHLVLTNLDGSRRVIFDQI
ncbi:hypothetical protein DY000_02016088 [Brassica cretica]|uniref:Uncharacterized protein n=1 Tax=Brassica cretica TaxID=69181 RepID=A0ABQ7D113_BRACR|nr:hypothetical protein DY000_02016088 [Brassica cretica]